MEALIRLAQRFVNLWIAVGPRRSVGIAARWLFGREYQVFCRDLQSPLPEVPRPAGLSWSILTEADLPCLRRVNPLMTDREARRRLDEGQTCHVGRIGPTLVHYRWDTTGRLRLPFSGRTFRPLPGDALADESFTHPRFRGRGIDASGLLVAYRWAKEHGCRRSITLVACWNTQSRRTQSKAGRSLVGTVGFRLGRRGRRHFVTGLACFDEQGALYVAPN